VAGVRKAAVDVIGVAIAELLPSPYRGAYGGPEWDEARAFLRKARAT
jgi:hypothetical protein